MARMGDSLNDWSDASREVSVPRPDSAYRARIVFCERSSVPVLPVAPDRVDVVGCDFETTDGDNDDDDRLFLDIVRNTVPCPVSSDPSVSTSK